MSEKLPEYNSKSTPQNDEVDLGQLFKLIGNAFQGVINFFVGIFKGLFNFLILFLLFIRKHIVKLGLAAIIGAAIGYYIDYVTPPRFISTMVVEPNFNSVQQLYNNVEFYNQLARSNDSIYLAAAFGNIITTSEAAALKKIEVLSYSDENQRIRLFNEFIKGLDTTTVKSVDMESYLKNFNSKDARFHTISVVSTNSMVAKKLEIPIITSIENNTYFETQKNTAVQNFDLQEDILINKRAEIDSLQQFYKMIMLEEAKKPTASTSINLSDNGKKGTGEIELLAEIDKLKMELVVLNQEKANKLNIVNVISSFPDKGVKQTGIFKKYTVLLGLGTLFLMIIILLIIQLNTYLSNYKPKN